MSGSLAFDATAAAAARARTITSTWSPTRGTLRLTDPRRFGAVRLVAGAGRAAGRELLARLGAEPFDPALDAAALSCRTATAAHVDQSGACWPATSSSAPATSTPARRCSRRHRPAHALHAPVRPRARAPAGQPAQDARAGARGSAARRCATFATPTAAPASSSSRRASMAATANPACVAARPVAARRPGAAIDVLLPAAARNAEPALRGGAHATRCTQCGHAPCQQMYRMPRRRRVPCARMPGAPDRRSNACRPLLDGTLPRRSTRRACRLAPRRSIARPRTSRRFWPTTTCATTAASADLDALRQRLATDRLCVAFVAEFSRGKSELINAIFFADTGRRVLPATPGRTTMCPVELGYEPEHAAAAGAAADRHPARGPVAGRPARAARALAPHPARCRVARAPGRGADRGQAHEGRDASTTRARSASGTTTRPRTTRRRSPTAWSRCRPGAMR